MGGAAVAAFAVVATVIGTAGAAPVPAKAKPWNPPRNVKQLDFVGGKTAPGVVPDSYIVILKNHPSVTSTNTTTIAALTPTCTRIPVSQATSTPTRSAPARPISAGAES